MRLTAVLLSMLLVAPLLQAAEPAAVSTVAPSAGGAWTSVKAEACKETDRLYDRREITCTVPAAEGKRWQFKAKFTGGHDDTSASIESMLNDGALKCDDGSKPTLFGEDGDVYVHCQFGSATTKGQPAKLVVLIKWSHAEFADFDFLATNG